MNRIVTRGMGDSQTLCTRGYSLSRFLREVLRLISRIKQSLSLESEIWS